MRKIIALALALPLSSCILFDPDARVRPVCQLIADACDQDEDDVDNCEEDNRENRQFMRQQSEDCIEVLIAQDELHICVLEQDDVDCPLGFPVFDGCQDEVEEFFNETFEAGGDCQR